MKWLFWNTQTARLGPAGAWQAMAQFIQQPPSHWHIMLDDMTEICQTLALPPLGARDRQAYLTQQAQQCFPDTAWHCTRQQGDRAVCCGLPQAHGLATLQAAGHRLCAVYSISIASAALLDDGLYLLASSTGQARLLLVENSLPVFVRVLPLSNLATELQRSQQYLQHQGLGPGAALQFDPVLDLPDVNAKPLPLAEIARHWRVRPGASWAETLCAVLARQKPASHYPLPAGAQRKFALHAAAAILVLLAGWQAHWAWRFAQQNQRTEAGQVALPAPTATLRALAELDATHLERAEPETATRALSQILLDFPELILDRLEWRAGGAMQLHGRLNGQIPTQLAERLPGLEVLTAPAGEFTIRTTGVAP